MYLAKYMRVLVRSRTGERKKEKEAGDENLGTLWEAWRHVGSQGIHNISDAIRKDLQGFVKEIVLSTQEAVF